jgi:hypothetical protein
MTTGQTKKGVLPLDRALVMLLLIWLTGTKVTKAGEAMLFKALPRCRIER